MLIQHLSPQPQPPRLSTNPLSAGASVGRSASAPSLGASIEAGSATLLIFTVGVSLEITLSVLGTATAEIHARVTEEASTSHPGEVVASRAIDIKQHRSKLDLLQERHASETIPT